MTTTIQRLPSTKASIMDAAAIACRAIPPMWPLSSSVAVNPYLGQSGISLAETGAKLERLGGVPVTMKRAWYAARIEAGEISDTDIADALSANTLCRLSVETVKALARTEAPQTPAIPTIADLAGRVSGMDWPAVVTDRFGAWASGYFDAGQAFWMPQKQQGAWRSWRSWASHDLTPGILGLSGLAALADNAPRDPEVQIMEAVTVLGLSPEALPGFFHQLLHSLGGWAQLARYRQWQAQLDGGDDTTIMECLAIRLCLETALFKQYADAIGFDWQDSIRRHRAPVEISRELWVNVILQEAAERAAHRRLALVLALPRPQPAPSGTPARLQAVFCIDVRSEVFRRALESQDPSIQTLGFAGFFGLGIAHRDFASDTLERRLPVLLTAKLHARSGGPEDSKADASARIKARATRAWARFKLAAVSSFAFVESAGPLYIGKLVSDTFGVAKRKSDKHAPTFESAFDAEARADAAESILRAMSLTQDFAELVLLVGHGANVTNNPHASALHCGACGGYAGDVNARLLAGVLNDDRVREALCQRGIPIPAATLFVGGLHDTTTDRVALYADAQAGPTQSEALVRAQAWLDAAGALARSERALRLPGARGEHSIAARSRDWSEVRPEWGLAGCSTFIAAPRAQTLGKALEGRAFLHDYCWQQDEEFKVLELIMTAPVVVASWISLQYYGSTVSPHTFGAGNKLLHNVTGGIGVVEGNGGNLRTGLPWQSVHDGKDFVHEPLRLTVCVQAPREAMSEILSRHDDVRALFDNRWLGLFILDATGQIAWRYERGLNWSRFEDPGVGRAVAREAC